MYLIDRYCLKLLKDGKMSEPLIKIHRMFLKDLIPYEVPFFWSVDGYYEFLSKLTIGEQYLKPFFEKKNKESYISFNFMIKKNNESHRQLSIGHPRILLSLSDLIVRNSSLILTLCSRSNYSIRYPKRVASIHVDKNKIDFKTSKTGQEFINLESETGAYQSFFSYMKYSNLGKFYDSDEYLELDRKYKYVCSLDIAKFFSNIYTHSISWAVKDKTEVKKLLSNSAESFESEFDSLMQKSNYNETHGILIGSEVSRIFAEIISQRVDQNIEHVLRLQNLELNVNYGLLRYVDDYIIFANKLEDIKVIELAIEKEISHYKLHLNDSKRFISTTPYTSNISAAKKIASNYLSSLFSDISIEVDGSNGEKVKTIFIKSHRVKLLQYIKEFRVVLKQFDTEPSVIVPYIFGMLKKRLRSYIFQLYKLQDKDKINIEAILFFIELMFYLLSYDARYSTIRVFSESILILVKEVACNYKSEIQKNILFSKTIELLKDKVQEVYEQNPQLSLELINLLVLSKVLHKKFGWSFKDFYLIIEKMVLDQASLIYFEIIAILFLFVNDEPLFNTIGIKDKVTKSIHNILTDDNASSRSDSYMLALDVLTCPLLYMEHDKLFCMNKARTSFDVIKNIFKISTISEQQKFMLSVKDVNMFTDWELSNNDKLFNVIYKKRFRKNSYD